MRHPLLRSLSTAAVCALLIPSIGYAREDISGQYDGDTISVRIDAHGDTITGEIQKGASHFPLSLREQDGKLIGVFSTDGGKFPLTATIAKTELTLSTGGTTYSLKKHADAPNTISDLPGYVAVASTDVGKAMLVEKPKATSVTTAFQQTFPDLARYFGERPTIVGAFEDVKNHNTGGASFTAHLNGRPIKGFVSCKLTEKGAKLAIVYCNADAPQAEWDKLVAKPAASAPGAPQIKLREYQFPDNTGTVAIAEGWQTNSQSLMEGVAIKGPADQEVNLAFGASVNAPDGPMVQTYMQMVANARQFGMAPPPPLPVTTMIAAYSDPATALKELTPQFSRMSQAAGGPALSIDKIISVQKASTILPNGQAALIVFDLTKTSHGVSKHYRSGIRWDMGAVTPGGWMICTSQIIAPVETFDQDAPTMLAMAMSLKENPQVIMEKTRINIEAANARFAAQQRANKELLAAFDAQNRAWERRGLIQSRSFADFDETIVGYRTVEDTSTGTRRSVDLGNVHDVVDHLNRVEPGRFKEVPLRDEMYPLPGR